MSDMVTCSVNSCVYNRSLHCGAGNIKVHGQKITNGSGDTCCGSYLLVGSPKGTAWLAGPAEFKSGLTQLTDDEDMKPMVCCTVDNCRYFEQGCCAAPDLHIENQRADSHFTTMCRTFCRKY